MSAHVFVDETKHRGYLLVAVVVRPHDLDPMRKVIRGLVLPGQRRLHMKDESDSRKRAIASAVACSGTTATVYDAGTRRQNERDRRTACLRALAQDVGRRGDGLLILEQDDMLAASDRKVLYEAARRTGRQPAFRYHHDRASAEPLLALPDAVAWCWAKGGDWRRRVTGVVADVRQV